MTFMNATEGGSWTVGIFLESPSCFGGTALGETLETGLECRRNAWTEAGGE